MSMTLYLGDEFEQNLTYNYGGMWAKAIGKPEDWPPAGVLFDAHKTRMLEIDGMTGCQSLQILELAIKNMKADMPSFRALNPSNGWGDADSFLNHLKAIRLAAIEYPNEFWEASR